MTQIHRNNPSELNNLSIVDLAFNTRQRNEVFSDLHLKGKQN
jgi:hypothetical protein